MNKLINGNYIQYHENNNPKREQEFTTEGIKKNWIFKITKNMKNVNDAYKYTMEMINSLKKEGIEVELEIPRCIRESENPNELDTVKKYCPPERLHWKKMATCYI